MNKNAQKEKIAKLVKEARLKKGYSQQQLADLTQLNLRSVQRIEKAEVLPRAYSLNLLAQQLNLDVETLKDLSTIAVEEIPVAIPVDLRKTGRQPRKIILSLTFGLLTILLTAAFLSQATRFPETAFELFLLLALIICFAAVVFWRIWK